MSRLSPTQKWKWHFVTLARNRGSSNNVGMWNKHNVYLWVTAYQRFLQQPIVLFYQTSLISMHALTWDQAGIDDITILTFALKHGRQLLKDRGASAFPGHATSNDRAVNILQAALTCVRNLFLSTVRAAATDKFACAGSGPFNMIISYSAALSSSRLWWSRTLLQTHWSCFPRYSLVEISARGEYIWKDTDWEKRNSILLQMLYNT